ncbi:MAG: hypothetical protein ACKOTB_17280, partial [Planctomycetia bacterium]
LAADWLPALLTGRFAATFHPARVVFAAQAAEAQEAVPWIVSALAEGRLSAEDRQAALSAVARLGTPDHQKLVVEALTAAGTPPARAAALLRDLLEAHARRRTVPAGDLTRVERLVTSPDDACAIKAIEAVAAWQVLAADEELAAVARAGDRGAAVRMAAVAALGLLPGVAPRATLVGLCGSAAEGEAFPAAAIAALVPRSPAEAASQAVTFLARARDAKARDPVFRAFLAAKGGAATLAAALDAAATRLAEAAVKDGRQAVSASGRPEPALEAALTAALARSPGGATAVSAHAMRGAELEAFVTLVRTKADARRGAEVYARESLKCVSCHRIGDQGGRVGPNLTALGAASPLDYVIDSLLEPAKNVKEGYATVVVQTTDGRVLTGIQVARSDEELALRDATGTEIRIPMADVDEESVGSSLMPAGLVDPLSRDELADLVRYLSELGS